MNTENKLNLKYRRFVISFMLQKRNRNVSLFMFISVLLL